MTWPTATISTTHLDAGADDPSQARADLKTAVDQINAMRDWLAGPRVDVATHATSMDIGAQTSGLQRWTGTATVTSLGSSYDAPCIDVTAAGDFTLQHNATTLVLPGGVDLAVKTGDHLRFMPRATSGTPDGWELVSLLRGAPVYAFYVKDSGTRTTAGDFSGYSFEEDSGSWFDNTTGIATAPVTGWYQFNAVVRFAGGSAAGQGVVKLSTSNQAPSDVAKYDGTTMAEPSTLSIVIKLSASQTAKVRLDSVVTGSATYFCEHFSGMLIREA